MRLSFLAVVAVLILSGCNTLRQNVYEKVQVRTPGVENAVCDLYTDKNYYTVMTPRQVTVERSDLPLTVICKKPGYYMASVIVDPVIYEPDMPLNAANGYLPGAIVDVASNSIYNYPETITVILLPMPPQQLPSERAFVTQKKVEPVYKRTVSKSTAADKSLSKSGRK